MVQGRLKDRDNFSKWQSLCGNRTGISRSGFLVEGQEEVGR